LAATVQALRSIGLAVSKDMSGFDKAYWIACGDGLDRILRGEALPSAIHREDGKRSPIRETRGMAKQKAAKRPKKSHAARR
jgi:hypothetical protein